MHVRVFDRAIPSSIHMAAQAIMAERNEKGECERNVSSKTINEEGGGREGPA